MSNEIATSPIRERQNSLEAALSKRPDAKDLEERNILHSGAPAIQQRQQELERAMTQDTLKKQLAHNVDEKIQLRDDLIQRNILPEKINVAPALLAHQKELERNMLEDGLKEKLAHRPEVSEVIEKGILKPDEDPTSPKE